MIMDGVLTSRRMMAFPDPLESTILTLEQSVSTLAFCNLPCAASDETVSAEPQEAAACVQLGRHGESSCSTTDGTHQSSSPKYADDNLCGVGRDHRHEIKDSSHADAEVSLPRERPRARRVRHDLGAQWNTARRRHYARPAVSTWR
ncbi:hypothetical protein FDECE_14346 [Fusarium decemcellulare]|nr:hypothetical protein FDECE_14346 [Fusarium decemcellulare]